MKANLFKLFFLYLIYISQKTICQTCVSVTSISYSQCFTNIIYFNLENKEYRAGHFAMNSKGDIIIEYSYDQYRLFYGLRGNGTLYFSEGTKEIEIISDTINSNILKRYESINFFVSFMDDINKENEYLMNISSYITILELHDFQNDQYSLREATNFVDKPAGIYSYIFQVLEAKINSQIYYFCIYIYKIGNNSGQYRYKLAILKFRIPNFDLNAIIEDGNENVENTPGNRISSSVIITQFDLLALFYMNV